MQNPLRIIRRSFRSPVKNRPSRTREESDDKIARSVVGRIATGNVLLQRGQYVTKEDTKKRLERLKNHRFADE